MNLNLKTCLNLKRLWLLIGFGLIKFTELEFSKLEFKNKALNLWCLKLLDLNSKQTV
ncbi:hypothetical protein [Campylobacter troglodytis]|uniref:hypothetical protein n=1 Tax=Campylobacter troglodytis TaxID=654363 RepID=UPI00163C0A69|nr:hypothetical protein [Campylobacter troglodytis]